MLSTWSTSITYDTSSKSKYILHHCITIRCQVPPFPADHHITRLGRPTSGTEVDLLEYSTNTRRSSHMFELNCDVTVGINRIDWLRLCFWGFGVRDLQYRSRDRRSIYYPNSSHYILLLCSFYEYRISEPPYSIIMVSYNTPEAVLQLGIIDPEIEQVNTHSIREKNRNQRS
jgi:hypothetical protein